MAGFVEAWGRGYELITEAFTKEGLEVPTIEEEFGGVRVIKEGLEVPTIEEEFGGVRVIVKREIFYGIQHGGRIDPKTGRLIKAGDTKNVTNDVTKKLTERQRVILEMLPFGDIENVTKNERVTTALLAGRFGKDPRTIKRDMKVLQDLGIVTHVGPSNGGYWKRLK